MASASVVLSTTFLSLQADPLNALQLGVSSKTITSTVSGRMAQYAGGRFRAVSQAGLSRSAAVTFTLVNLDDRTTLEGWVGQMVCYRDPQGTKMFGVYFSAGMVSKIAPNVADVSVTINEVTFSEAV